MKALMAGLALAACLGTNALAQAQAGGQGDKSSGGNTGKRETIHGIIAGVTVEGETAIDYNTRTAQTVAASYLVIVGSPGHGGAHRESASADRQGNNSGDRNRGERRRHNVYVVWLTPKTELHDATSASHDKAEGSQAVRTTFDKIEVGDRVEVTFHPKELTTSAGDRESPAARRHGRHRTYYGDAVSLTILSEPGPAHDADRAGSSRDKDKDKDKERDDDKDKVKKP